LTEEKEQTGIKRVCQICSYAHEPATNRFRLLTYMYEMMSILLLQWSLC